MTSRPYGPVEKEALLSAVGHAPANIGQTIRTALELAARGLTGHEAFANGLGKDNWQDAQRWVKTHRLPALTSHELRRAWSLEMATEHTVLECLSLGITEGELDGVLQHLDRGNPHDVIVALRSM